MKRLMSWFEDASDEKFVRNMRIGTAVVFLLNLVILWAIVSATVSLYQHTSGLTTFGLIMMSTMGGLDTLSNLIKGFSTFLNPLIYRIHRS